MSNENSKSISFIVTQNLSYIQLPQSLNFKVSKIRISALSYTTSDTNLSNFILISIKNFPQKSVYISSNNNTGNMMPYSLYIPLNSAYGALTTYINHFKDSYDGLLDNAVSLSNLSVEILINGVYSSQISALNPVYIEIFISE